MCAQAHQETHTNMFTAALLEIAENGKQSKYPSVMELIHKLWYINVLHTPPCGIQQKHIQSSATSKHG